jgi:hypothetical protein
MLVFAFQLPGLHVSDVETEIGDLNIVEILVSASISPAAGAPLQDLPPSYSATEVDGWQHKLSRVPQNWVAAHVHSRAEAATLDP